MTPRSSSVLVGIAALWVGAAVAGETAEAKAAEAPATTAETLPEEGPIPYGLAGDIACAPCGVDVDRKAASTALKGYPVDKALDEDVSSAWCEGVDGAGVGSWIEVGWNEPRTVAGFEFVGGYAKSWALLEANARVKTVTVFADGKATNRVTLQDPLATKPKGAKDEPGGLDYGTLWPALFGPALGDKQATTIRLRIDAVYPGSKYQDTCVSTWTVYSVDPEELE